MSNDTPTRVMFVDDEPRLLDGLRRQLRSHRSKWDMRFAESAASALAELQTQPADIVISDMRMPGMNGAELLTEVRDRWPNTIRFILSGQTDQSELLQNVGAIHQFLQKPCDARVIEQAVVRTSSLATGVNSPALRKTVGGILSLPLSDQTYRELSDALNDDEVKVEDLAQIVERNLALSVKIFQLVNSAFFGLPRPVSQCGDAIKLIGLKNLKVLVLSSQIFDALADHGASETHLKSLWTISADLSASAFALARSHGAPEPVCNYARLAGTLALTGRAILAGLMPERFEEALKMSEDPDCTLTEAEQDVFGVSQDVIGAYALGLWAFDDSVVDAVAYQTRPAWRCRANRTAR